ncbi:MAG: hypothetical protein RL026_1615 [Pseudomonadota bacterium]|jgi:prolyl 4-hydroxylase
MQDTPLTPALRDRITRHTLAGGMPDVLLEELLSAGWEESVALDVLEQTIREVLAQHARAHDLPEPTPVPAWVSMNDQGIIDIDGQEIRVLAQMLLPRVVVLGNLLTPEECRALIELARPRLVRSRVVDPGTGGESEHEGRTSQGMAFRRGENALCQRIEERIAKLLQWPVSHGEAIQVLRYAPGAQYRPHHDYFDPREAAFAPTLARGGQRVATLVMYLNTPERGGSTTFPDVNMEVTAHAGNAVYFSYDRPHPMTRSLHGGSPVRSGEKWIATKWLRAGPHE